ncbi:SusC/RagA family TonB-linked outer membrane protein [Pseudobacter ginsenosidimutans]|uniref:TonB-linked SusC/RagA family outer membrane protein n=1 Tax=Pseudobacter ginsenosidimutans TaxID=661488 RepID=A0A4Q7N3N0_9BACT|nr:SusC/RagA family TonB-linked outer membrane protein [Pseudobacter ginsenosidimutans]RZS75568.1 TonB-linked SusC/RagA family outer membrane protein [Pseudobacter ginsenosidimutans]
MQKTAYGSWLFPVGISKAPAGLGIRLPAQMLRIMRMLSFLLFVAFLSVKAEGVAQNVSINGKELTLKQVFASVEKQTGYVVFLNQDMFDEISRKVSLQVKDMPVPSLLDLLFRERPIEYIIQGKTIILSTRIIPVAKAPGLVLFAPPKPVRGKVTDENGQALAGASISVKNAKTVGITEADGSFSVNVDEGDVIVISYVEHESKEIKITAAMISSGMISVSLNKALAELNEVKVNAGYYTVKARERTGSISKVSTKTIEQQPVTNPLSALAGRVPGLEIVQASGQVGAGFKVQIRGQNSISSGNNPLMIIDGVPFPLESIGSSQVSLHLVSGVGIGAISPMNSINPQDIESIEVLKDADATAIYGSRGSNGVILITTKKGTGGKTKYEVGYSAGFSKISRRTKLMNTEQYLQMRREAFANEGKTPGAADPDVNGTWGDTKNTDWQKELAGNTARRSRYYASISGGTDRTRLLLKGTYERETTVFPGNLKYGRGSGLVNINHRSTDNKFSINFSAMYSSDNNNAIAVDLYRYALSLPPNTPDLLLPDGSLNWDLGSRENPLRNLNQRYESHAKSLNTNATIEYKFLENLTAKVSAGYSDYRLDEQRIFPYTLLFNPGLNPSSASSSTYANISNRGNWNFEPQLNFGKDFGRSRIELLAGMSFQKSITSGTTRSAIGFPSDYLIYDFKAALTSSIYSADDIKYAYSAGFGRINYNYDGKYILNLTARRDASSRFGPENRSANFAAIGGAWIFSREKFIDRLLPFLNFGKLRASYGTTGNDQIADYSYLSVYASGQEKYQTGTGLGPVRFENPVLGWEENKKLEIALELGLFNDRITTSVAWFRNRSGNQLLSYPLPSITGFNNVLQNIGALIENSGWEFELNTINIDKKNIKWRTYLNASIPRNKLLSYPDLAYSTNASKYIVGQPLDILRLYEFTGIDFNTGLYTFKDVNKDGVYNIVDRTQVGRLGTLFTGGMGNQFTFKNWSFDFFFQYVQQNKRFVSAYTGVIGNMSNLPEVLTDRSIPGAKTGTYQRAGIIAYSPAVLTANTMSYSSTLSPVSANYVKLRNLSLAYSIPELGKSSIGCKLFLQGQNLLTISRYPGADPETEFNYLPTLRTITFGASLIF